MSKINAHTYLEYCNINGHFIDIAFEVFVLN